ncbi:MAG: YceI family protein [Steroidobacteraceae bacterium]|jgi:polyisoprenoid-binding protein YceI
MKSLIALGFAALLSTTLSAAPITYAVDTSHTYERFAYTHMGFSQQEQRFDKTSGSVVYDAAAKSATVDITIDATSVSTGSALNEHIQGADFLDTAKFPTITFKSTSVQFNAAGEPASITGDLTIKGVTKPVTLTVTHFKHAQNPMMKKDEIGANATATISRSDFNAGKFAPLVDDQLLLTIAFEAQAQ